MGTPVDEDVAVLLNRELVTNGVRHTTAETVIIGIRYAHDRLRVDVHDTSRSLPVLMNPAADEEAGSGLMLVNDLAAEWGYYRTPMGKAVFFALSSQPDPAGAVS